MNTRQEHILKLVVDEYIRTAEPVGSKFLAQRRGLDVSPATIRNDMVELEALGFLAQPHTSAGRVPTEKAFVYYLQHFVEPTSAPVADKQLRCAVEECEDDDRKMRTLAKTLTDLSGEMAIVAYGGNRSYYTGVANLFQKPEFANLEIVQQLSAMVDRFDEVVEDIFDAVSQEPQVMIGSENPFGEHMSSILVKYSLPGGHVGIIGIVGPMRMDYGRNIRLVERAKDILDEDV